MPSEADADPLTKADPAGLAKYLQRRYNVVNTVIGR
jgi:hypothetical protein